MGGPGKWERRWKERDVVEGGYEVVEEGEAEEVRNMLVLGMSMVVGAVRMMRR